MVDWTFWGSPRAWKMIGLGSLLVVVALVVSLLGARTPLLWIIVGAGAVLVAVPATYLVYWENWVLFKRERRMREKEGNRDTGH